MSNNNTGAESKVALIRAEINREIADPDAFKSLLDTTFKGLEPATAKRAMLEGMIRGFKFENFLNRDVYAVPFGQTYSLVTSIDYSRKIGARSGIVGVDAPVYKEQDSKIISCSVSVYKNINGYIGKFTAEVDFKEYSTGKNLWASKPRTMIAKVAEMHALRKACPEELAQAYVQEEVERETIKDVPAFDITGAEKLIRSCKTIEGLRVIWADLPGDAKASATLKEAFSDMEAILLAEAGEAAKAA